MAAIAALSLYTTHLSALGLPLRSPLIVAPYARCGATAARRTARSISPCMLDALDVVPPSTSFPVLLDALDATPRTSKAVLGPVSRSVRGLPAEQGSSLVEVLTATPMPIDALLVLLLATGLYLGPDFLLAPLGLASNARLGYRTEAAVGAVLSPGEAWLVDRAEGLAAEAPLLVQVATVALYLIFSYLLERVLTAASSDTLVFYLGASASIWGGLFEVARPRLRTRSQEEERRAWEADFARFAEARLTASGTCHETEIVRAFRRSYPRYRAGRGISDREILELMRRWMRVPRTQLLPGGAIATEVVSSRSAAGYYTVALTKEPDVGLG